MPDRPPSDFSSQSDWTGYCVPFMMDEGMENDQAVAACLQMWRDKSAAPLADRAWSTLTVKTIDAERREIEGIASTPTVDRVGDVVEPLGAKFTLPLPLLAHHRHDQPVGQVTSARVSKDGISIKAKFAKVLEPGPLKDRIDTAWGEVRSGLVRGLSIGFKPIDVEPLDVKDPFGGLRFNTYNLYELSLVTIAANQDANISIIKSADQAASGHTAPTTRPGATGKASISLKRSERTMSKTISEQIEALQAARSAKDARMDAIMTKAMDDGRSTDAAEKAEFDELQEEVEEIDADLKRLDYLEKRNRAQAKPVTPDATKTFADGAAARGGYVRVKSPDLPKGIRFARVVKCLGLAGGDRWGATQIAERMYGDDQGVVNILKAASMSGQLSDTVVQKAAVQAGTTIDSPWAGALVGDETSVFADFVEFLRPQTILGKFGNNGVPALRRVPFRTALISQTGGMEGYWVGEGQPKPVTSATFTRTTLEPLKAANICVVTEELLRDSSPSAEGLLRDELARAIAERLDIDFISPAKTAVAGTSPASITNGVTAVASTGGVDGDAVRADVAALWDAFIAASNPASGAVFIMPSSVAMRLGLMTNALGQMEFNTVGMNGGTFMGIPVITSEYFTTSVGSPSSRNVILAAANDIYLGDEGGISVDMSREASLQMDSAPTNAVVGPGGSPLSTAVATTVVSLWQTNSVGFRAERTINWMKRRTTSVQMLQNVSWGT